MSGRYRKLGHKLVYKGHIVDFYEDKMELANNNIVNWDYIQHNGAAAIVPYDNDNKIIMVRQYRIGADKPLLEIPAGGINKGEDAYTAAVRELTEETGYKANEVAHLIDVHSAPAYTSECVYIYYAKDLYKAERNLDDDEIIDVEKYDIDELIEMIMKGYITDGKTIAGIFAFKKVLQSE